MQDGESPTPKSAETHISWVILTGELAFKIAKPIATDVVDQRDRDRRREACENEVRLNARLAPDVYLGVGHIQLGGEALEPVVVMRRMPEDRRLAALLEDPEAGDLVHRVARTIAAFHASTRVLEGDDARRVASVPALENRWRDDIAGTRELVTGDLADTVDRVEDLATAYLAGRGRLFDARIDAGMVRDGHGDLLADDIFCLADGPRILDCLAFSDALRWGDVLADVGFLVMDLQRLGHPELARRLLADYCEFSGEHHPGSLAHLYVAQRALVRAKVAALRHSQRGGTGDTGNDVTDLLDLVVHHLERADIRVALVGGLPGSGKSTLAGRLSDEMGWAVLSSDEIRRDMGLRYADLHDDTAYDPATKQAVYEEMLRRARELVEMGISVVLDATWTSAGERARARDMAAATRARAVEIRCDAPADVLRDRVGSRERRGQSEASPAVVDVLGDRADPWPEATVFDTSDRGEPDAVWATVSSRSTTWWRSAPPTIRGR